MEIVGETLLGGEKLLEGGSVLDLCLACPVSRVEVLFKSGAKIDLREGVTLPNLEFAMLSPIKGLSGE
jgi:hypothetical protein